MNKKIYVVNSYEWLLFSIIMCTNGLHSRSPLREMRSQMPELIVSWNGDTKTHKIRNNHLGIYPFFHLYDEAYLKQFTLPDGKIPLRNEQQKSVAGSEMKGQINGLLQELKSKKQTFTHFIVLQSKDYNFDKNWGLLVLKFKEYPFVLKLFIETPEGIVTPFNKGIEPIFFFYMGAGVSRHLTGFTRIKNRETVLDVIKKNPELSEKVDIPQKWFWIPAESRMITLQAKHFSDDILENKIPGTYVVIAECIESERKFSLSASVDRKIALDLCNQLDLMIDPHIKNFMFDKHTKKLAIVDTEHFPTATGLNSRGPFNSYLQWYFHLTSKCIRDMFLLTKRERIKRQRTNPLRALGSDNRA